MRPHDAVGGGNDRPRKASAASATIIPATAFVASTTEIPARFGSTCRTTIQPVGCPSARDATTKSSSRSCRVFPRITRAVPVQAVSPRTRNKVPSVVRSIAAPSAIKSSRNGNASSTSTVRIATSSKSTRGHGRRLPRSVDTRAASPQIDSAASVAASV